MPRSAEGGVCCREVRASREPDCGSAAGPAEWAEVRGAEERAGAARLEV